MGGRGGRDVRRGAVGWERSGEAGLGKGHVTDFVRNFSIVDMRRRLSSTASLIRWNNNTSQRPMRKEVTHISMRPHSRRKLYPHACTH